MHAITIAPLGLTCITCLYWKISFKIQSFYSFMSQKAQKRKSTWFVAKKCTWQCKILSMLRVAAQTDILDFNLKYFPSLFCYLEQRTVRNSRGPFPSMFSLMKWQVFVTQISQIFAIISDGSWTSVPCPHRVQQACIYCIWSIRTKHGFRMFFELNDPAL